MIRCWRSRWWLVRQVGDSASRPAWLARHLAQCPVCRAEQARHEAIATGLRGSVPGGEAPPFLAARIVNTALATGPAPARPEWGWRMTRAPGGVSVAMVLLALGLGGWFALRQRGPSVSHPASGAELATLVSSSLGLPSGQRWIEAAKRLDNPLEVELRSLLTDVTNTWHTLAADLPRAEMP